MGADFIAQDRLALILGDNIFYGHGLPDTMARARPTGATIYGYAVKAPQ